MPNTGGSADSTPEQQPTQSEGLITNEITQLAQSHADSVANVLGSVDSLIQNSQNREKKITVKTKLEAVLDKVGVSFADFKSKFSNFLKRLGIDVDNINTSDELKQLLKELDIKIDEITPRELEKFNEDLKTQLDKTENDQEVIKNIEKKSYLSGKVGHQIEMSEDGKLTDLSKKQLYKAYLKNKKIAGLMDQNSIHGLPDSFEEFANKDESFHVETLKRLDESIKTKKEPQEKRDKTILKTILRDEERRRKLEEVRSKTQEQSEKDKIDQEIRHIDEFATDRFVKVENGKTEVVEDKDSKTQTIKKRKPEDDSRYLLRRVHLLENEKVRTEKKLVSEITPEIEAKAEIEELIQLKEVRDSLLSTVDTTTRTQIAIDSVEDVIAEAINDIEGKTDNKTGEKKTKALERKKRFDKGGEMITTEEINKAINEIFPVNMKLIVEAAQGNEEAKKQIQEYQLKRELTKEALQNVRKRINADVGEYIRNKEGFRKNILEKLNNRGNRIETSKKYDINNENEDSKPSILMTNSGHSVLVFDNVESYIQAVAPRLFKEGLDGKSPMSGEELKKYFEEVLEKNGSAQMAIDMSTNDTVGDTSYGDTVIAMLVNDKQVTPIENKAIGVRFLTNGLDDDKTKQRASKIASHILAHEDMHLKEYDYMLGIERALKNINEQESGISRELKDAITLDPESITRISALKKRFELRRKTLEQLKGENIENIHISRYERSLSELSTGIMQAGSKNISLAEISILDPNSDPSFKMMGISEANKGEIKEKVDSQVYQLLELTNRILADSELANEEGRKKVTQRILDIYWGSGVDSIKIDKSEVQRLETMRPEQIRMALAELINSYLFDKDHKDLSGILNIFKDIAGVDDKFLEEKAKKFKTNSKELYSENLKEFSAGANMANVSTDDNRLRLYDIAATVGVRQANNPAYPRRFDMGGHRIQPLHADLFPGFKWLHAKARWNLFPNVYQDTWRDPKSGKPSWDLFWRDVSYNPSQVTDKDNVGPFFNYFTQEIIGAYMHFAEVANKNSPEELMGLNLYEKYTDADAPTPSDIGKIKLDHSGRPIVRSKASYTKYDAGPLGRVMQGIMRVPGIGDMYKGYLRNYPAGFGSKLVKPFGRGPIARLVSMAIFGEQRVNDQINYDSPPNRRYDEMFTDEEAAINNGLAPDGKPRIAMIQEGNMLPHWDYETKRIRPLPYINNDQVVVNMEMHRKASIATMIGLLTKTGINERSLRLMIMQYLPELNLQGNGIPDFDITESTRSLRQTDLDSNLVDVGGVKVNQRLEKNKTTIQKFLDETKTSFGIVDGDAVEEILDTDVIRGHIHEEYLESMIKRTQSYAGEGYGTRRMSTGGYIDNVRDQHPKIMDHVFRAMHYENSIRHLRRKYLNNDLSRSDAKKEELKTQLETWQAQFDTEMAFIRDVKNGDPVAVNTLIARGIDPDDYKLKSTAMIQREVYDKILTPTTTLTINYNGRDIILDKDKIDKLFVKHEVDGAPIGFVFDTKDKANESFGIGQLQQMSYTSEINEFNPYEITRKVTVGGGFKLENEQVQIFLRNLYYEYFERMMRKGIKPDSVFLPGNTQYQNTYIRDENWTTDVSSQSITDEFAYISDFAPAEYAINPATGRMEGVKDAAGNVIMRSVQRPKKYNEYFLDKLILSLVTPPGSPVNPAHIVNGRAVPPAIGSIVNNSLWESLKRNFGINDPTELENVFKDHQKVVEACNEDSRILENVFGKNAALQSTIRDENNQPIPIRPVPGVESLLDRLFKENAMLQEVEDAIGRAENQNIYLAVLDNYLFRARDSIMYSKARAEMFAKRSKMIKVFRYFVTFVTAMSFINFAAIPTAGIAALMIPASLPLPLWTYFLTIAASYYEAYGSTVQNGIWRAREMHAVNYSQDLEQQTHRLEAKMRNFEIPSGEEMSDYMGQMAKYEALFEGIANVDEKEKEAGSNYITNILPSAVVGGIAFASQSARD